MMHQNEPLPALTPQQLAQVGGGASIYIDGMYWGEGDLDLRPWPGGFPVTYPMNMSFIR
jgi:hypothetical protein